MNKKTINKICESAISAYIDLSSPDFNFILKKINNKVYLDLVNEIMRNFYIKDVSDFNYDSCFSFSVKNIKNKLGWGLSLSLVGPYAFLARECEKKDFIVDSSNFKNDSEKKIIRILSENEIQNLTLEDLKQELPVKLIDPDLIDGESSNVFNILFSRAMFVEDL